MYEKRDEEWKSPQHPLSNGTSPSSVQETPTLLLPESSPAPMKVNTSLTPSSSSDGETTAILSQNQSVLSSFSDMEETQPLPSSIDQSPVINSMAYSNSSSDGPASSANATDVLIFQDGKSSANDDGEATMEMTEILEQHPIRSQPAQSENENADDSDSMEMTEVIENPAAIPSRNRIFSLDEDEDDAVSLNSESTQELTADLGAALKAKLSAIQPIEEDITMEMTEMLNPSPLPKGGLNNDSTEVSMDLTNTQNFAAVPTAASVNASMTDEVTMEMTNVQPAAPVTDSLPASRTQTQTSQLSRSFSDYAAPSLAKLAEHLLPETETAAGSCQGELQDSSTMDFTAMISPAPATLPAQMPSHGNGNLPAADRTADLTSRSMAMEMTGLVGGILQVNNNMTMTSVIPFNANANVNAQSKGSTGTGATAAPTPTSHSLQMEFTQPVGALLSVHEQDLTERMTQNYANILSQPQNLSQEEAKHPAMEQSLTMDLESEVEVEVEVEQTASLSRDISPAPVARPPLTPQSVRARLSQSHSASKCTPSASRSTGKQRAPSQILPESVTPPSVPRRSSAIRSRKSLAMSEMSPISGYSSTMDNLSFTPSGHGVVPEEEQPLPPTENTGTHSSHAQPSSTPLSSSTTSSDSGGALSTMDSMLEAMGITFLPLVRTTLRASSIGVASMPGTPLTRAAGPLYWATAIHRATIAGPDAAAFSWACAELKSQTERMDQELREERQLVAEDGAMRAMAQSKGALLLPHKEVCRKQARLEWGSWKAKLLRNEGIRMEEVQVALEEDLQLLRAHNQRAREAMTQMRLFMQRRQARTAQLSQLVQEADAQSNLVEILSTQREKQFHSLEQVQQRQQAVEAEVAVLLRQAEQQRQGQEAQQAAGTPADAGSHSLHLAQQACIGRHAAGLRGGSPSIYALQKEIKQMQKLTPCEWTESDQNQDQDDDLAVKASTLSFTCFSTQTNRRCRVQLDLPVSAQQCLAYCRGQAAKEANVSVRLEQLPGGKEVTDQEMEEIMQKTAQLPLGTGWVESIHRIVTQAL
jgi:hypothetical protein